MFVVNWRALGAREEPIERVVRRRGQRRSPCPVDDRDRAAGQSAAAGGVVDDPDQAAAAITSSIATVVKTVLPDWQGTDRVNILLLGIDKRDDEPIDGTRSDTIMIASIDPVTKSAAMVSLPRDLWVTIPAARRRWAAARVSSASTSRTPSADQTWPSGPSPPTSGARSSTTRGSISAASKSWSTRSVA